MSSPDELLPIFRALLVGEVDAARRLTLACRPRLYHILQKHSAGVLPEDAIDDAVTDALIALIKDPAKYRPERSSLLNYLAKIGYNKIIDQTRRIVRRQEQSVGGIVELAIVEAKQYREGISEERLPEDPDVLPAEVIALLEEILPEPRDRRLWEQICRGRTDTARCAAILEISHLPLPTQKSEVKRHLDRVKKRVHRRREEFRELLCNETEIML